MNIPYKNDSFKALNNRFKNFKITEFTEFFFITLLYFTEFSESLLSTEFTEFSFLHST